MSDQSFGGPWTLQKLKVLKKYLQAYVQIMKKHFREYIYIDAFAGNGRTELRQTKNSGSPDQITLIPGLLPEESQAKPEGSARITLQISPPFTRYIFVEKDPEKSKELENLRLEFPDRIIDIIEDDANIFVKNFCGTNRWINKRAVLFLDPFGMNVDWSTIESIAATKAIDLWYLFPLGVALNRLLTRDGNQGKRKKNELVRC